MVLIFLIIIIYYYLIYRREKDECQRVELDENDIYSAKLMKDIYHLIKAEMIRKLKCREHRNLSVVTLKELKTSLESFKVLRVLIQRVTVLVFHFLCCFLCLHIRNINWPHFFQVLKRCLEIARDIMPVCSPC